MSEIENIQRVLALWEIGLLSESEVVAWADRQVLERASPSDPVMELSLQGPKKCLLRRREMEFPHPYPLSFVEEFSLRATALALDSEDAVQGFVQWLSRRCMGEEINLPEVKLGYLVDHLWNDCGSMSLAVQGVRRELPPLLPSCQELASPFWTAVRS